MLDTLELGEIEGIHHGTYYEGMWWWHCPRLHAGRRRGLERHPSHRLPVHAARSRSAADRRHRPLRRRGDSWWVAALDERVKAAVPIAGITDLHNHIVDGTIEGHCDCMFMVNTYRWDFPRWPPWSPRGRC